MNLAYGLITGILFGILMQRAEVIRFDRQINALRLKDMTIVKFMLSTIIVSMIGVYLLIDLGQVSLSIKATSLGANIIGGLIFGLGWGILGYCPGTAAGALGEGRYDSLWGIVGMLAGAAVYAEVYPAFKSTVISWGNFGKITLASTLGINHWIIIIVLVTLFVGLMAFFEKKNI